MKSSYTRAPEEILRRSFAQVSEACDLACLPADLHDVALRLVHACAMPEIVDRLAWRGNIGAIGNELLSKGTLILTDCRMAASGISRARRSRIDCFLDADGCSAFALSENMTRSAAGVYLWRDRIGGSIVAIGNAPTALFQLLELIEEGIEPPALLLAFPIGFVGAAESKQALVENDGDFPFCSLLGRFGGSALAAAAVNALADPTKASTA
ncbi:MAG: precorrin-8X methylmutase [Hyphomicrobiales bacterium]|nr:precorrin-8X methylmutase [Hyphomicrobiales bacterium]MCY4053869.1 precorrin-8X methylmutase [Hyphomicrobiales bacterium]